MMMDVISNINLIHSRRERIPEMMTIPEAIPTIVMMITTIPTETAIITAEMKAVIIPAVMKRSAEITKVRK